MGTLKGDIIKAIAVDDLREWRARARAENHLRDRVREWIKFKKIDVNPVCSHVYLKGDQLDSLICDLIPLSKKEILVVSPYVEKSALCDLLMQGIKKGIDVQLSHNRRQRITIQGSVSVQKFYITRP